MGTNARWVGEWDSNQTCYPYCGQLDEKFFVGWVYADANGGAAKAPLWLDSETGYSDPNGDEFAYELFASLEEAKASLSEEKWTFQIHPTSFKQ
jgi:hypothetical protein